MRLKKFLSVVLCAALTMSLAGCGKSEKASLLDKVKEAGVLKMAVSPDYAPYEFEDPSKSDQEKYVGADIELGKYIAKELGVKFEVIPMDFDACLAGITQGKADIAISAFYPTEARKKTVDFSDPYFDDAEQNIVILKKNEEKYSKVEGFNGEIVTAQNGSAQDSIIDNNLPEAKKQLVTKATEGIQMVKSGKAAGVVLQGVMARSVVAGDESLALAKPSFTYDEATLAAAIAKGETDFTKKVNEIVKKVADEKLYDKWLVDAEELSSSINQ